MTSCLHMCIKNEHFAFCFEHFFFLFYDCNLNTQCFVYLEYVKYQLGLHRNEQVFAKCNVYHTYIYMLYSCFMYRHVQTFFLYRNKLYIFPLLGLAKTWVLESVLWSVQLTMEARYHSIVPKAVLLSNYSGYRKKTYYVLCALSQIRYMLLWGERKRNR